MWYFIDNYKLEILYILFGIYNFFIKDAGIELLRTQIFIIFFCSFFSIFNYFFNIYADSLFFQIQTILLVYIMLTKLILNIKSDKINKKNVCIVFYRPKTFKQYLLSIFGLNVASSGLLIGNKLYQMRYENTTLQERDYTNKYIYSKYLVINTKFPISQLKGEWESELLKQKARQPKTFWLRFNCLRSLKAVLNQIPNYRYIGEILPSIYLFRLKIKGII